MIIMIVIRFSYDKGITMIKYRIFLNVTETGDFTKTAERFGYTQSAVSQMMKSLEEELKITLFTRTKHGIHLTSDGKAMLPYIRRLCDDYARVLGQSSAINHLDGAEIRIGTFASISANFLPYAIKRFKEIYPSVKFKLLQADYETVKTWIKDGVVDFGFLTVDVAEELERDFLMCCEYGYTRKSTPKQSIDRQIRNIKALFPNAIILQETYTGTKIDRKEWNKLYRAVKAGDTIIFDSVSRMSRNAAEGFEAYEALYNRGVHLIFLKDQLPSFLRLILYPCILHLNKHLLKEVVLKIMPYED